MTVGVQNRHDGSALASLLDRHGLLRALWEVEAKQDTVTLGLLDVDHFKELNDTCGHALGDRVLEAVAERLAGIAANTEGLAARIGGDEFAIAFPGAALESGFLHLERLRAQLRDALAAVVPADAPSGRTISAGVANHPRDVRHVDDLFMRADQALWQAKEGGRDQVALPMPEEMILKSNYYTAAQLGRLKRLAEVRSKKESVLLREALDDLLHKYDVKE